MKCVICSKGMLDNLYIFSQKSITEEIMLHASYAHKILCAQFLGETSFVILQYSHIFQQNMVRTEKDVYIIPHDAWYKISERHDFYIVNENFIKLTQPDETVIPQNIHNLIQSNKLESLYQHHGLVIGTSPLLA